jgi:hypothetical protein
MSTDTLSVQVETLTYQRDEWKRRARKTQAAGELLAQTLRDEHAECVDDLVPCPALRALAGWREAVTS